MTSSEGAKTPTQYIGTRVKELRTKRGWSARQLGDHLQAVGLHWDRSIVANVEHGRRQSFTVAEVTALATVFRVPPVLLMFPLGQDIEVELPGETMSPWSAVRWFGGEVQPAGEEEFGRGYYDAESDIYEWYEDPWTVESAPVKLFRRHQREVAGWWEATFLVQLMTGQYAGHAPMIAELENLSDESMDKWRNRLKGYYEQQIKRTREEIRGHGLKPPRLPHELSHLDPKDAE